MMKMYTWSKKPIFLAVVQAESAAAARQLLLDGDLGESGDGSCPERDEARKWVLGVMPHIYMGPNAEFALTDSGELRESEVTVESLRKQVAQLRRALEVAIMTVECASLGRDGTELPWYVGAQAALRDTDPAARGAA